ncbi:MAG: GDSL family lipase [Clostridia bacterium]|nr:GDSL family lipase [Clostridia bacterium]
MKLLFQGDSITDAGRDRSDPHNLGNGYPKYAAQLIEKRHPFDNIEFIDLGISGDRAESLRARRQSDCVDVQPDVVSILIGINDTWHRAAEKNWMTHEYFEECYRSILTDIKEKTSAKIIILEQFLLPVPDKAFFRCDLDPKIQITRALAREFADVFIPLDGMLAAECIDREPTYWSGDGVHPNENGARLIGGWYADAFDKVLRK